MSNIPMYIIDSKTAASLPAHELGGKAFNLASLSREGFSVPDWWALPTSVFKQHIKNGDLESWIATQVAGLNAQSPFADISNVADKIQQRIADVPLSLDLKAAIQEILPDTIDQDYWAVRSSIVGEDAEGASFAGQMDSFLYQKGFDAIFASIVGVLKSAFNPRALTYRLQRNIPVHDIQAAVIIQKMIDGDASGVMFTANPITSNRHQALISAAWGCGEGVVSGICNTDEFTVSLFSNHIDQVINTKDLAVKHDDSTGTGTKEVNIEPSKQNIPCLSQEQVLALRDVGVKIAESFLSPQDIEWTIADDQVYILQTRPITSLAEVANINDKQVVWDNSNIQESYCGVTTPLTFSFASKAYSTVYKQTLRVLGVSENVINAHQDMLDNMLGLIKGRVFYNINNWYRGLLFLPAFSENKSDMERMMGLEDPVDMISDRALTLKEKLTRLPQIFRSLYQLVSRFRKMTSLVDTFLSEFKDVYSQINRSRLHMKSTGELIELSRYLDTHLLDRWTTPIVNDFYVMMMNGKVHRTLIKAGIANSEALQNNLMSGEEGIESTEPTKMLLSMCDDIRQDKALQDLITRSDNAHLLNLLQVQAPALHQRCLEYIELYGDRTMGELKLESVTLRQDASFMFAILKNFLTREDLTLSSLAEKEAGFRAEAEAEAFSQIKSKLGRRALAKFKKDLNKLRAAVKNRENMRLARTRMFGLYRDIYLEIGRQLTLFGKLTNERDIFYLTIDEIYAYYDGRSVTTDFVALVNVRKQEFASYQAEDVAHHFYTYGPAYLHNDFQYPHASADYSNASDTTLKGTGCYPGIVEKEIRLIFSPDDELSVNGNILCTVRTDPGWAPLFPTAGGIIVERGSTLSHSAVVARELGIPAIVGVPGLTSILKDQEVVRMDGSSGDIQRLN